MILGIDIGTSAVKVILWRDGATLGVAQVELRITSPHHGWSEQAPADWWEATCDALSQLAAQGHELARVRGIGLSGQMHGAVLLDRQGAVLRPAILWNDSRSITQCAAMEAEWPEMGSVLGVRPLPGFTAPKLRWLRDSEPEVHGRIAHLLLPKDYIGFRLHGAFVTDFSDAAGTLWLDQAARQWSERACEVSGVDPAWLPALRHGMDEAGQITAEAADATGLPQGCPVFAGAGDAATGAICLGVTEPGRGFISLGTSGQLMVADRAYRPNPDRFVHAFAHTVPDRWFQMACMLNGARPIAWVAGILGCTPSEVVALAATADPARAPLFLPYLTGERSPHGDPYIRGAFAGIEDSSDRAAMARAVTDAVAFTFADAADSFGDGLDDVPEVLAIGGGAQSDLVLQSIANATGRVIARTQGAETGPALGAAMLAACGLGDLSLSDLSRMPDIAGRFYPVADPVMQVRLARYRALYAALAPISAPH